MTPTLNSSNVGTDDPTDCRMVSGILRLASRYLVDSLRAKALAHLSTAWPNPLKGWDAREDLARADEALECQNSTPPLGKLPPSLDF